MVNILKQGKAPKWLGSLQVQLSNSNYYIVYYSQAMMVGTFWFTAGSPTAERYFPWLSFWGFMGFLFASMVILLLLDYKYMLPARQKFINKQACEHENPAMDLLYELKKDMQKIKAKLEIE